MFKNVRFKPLAALFGIAIAIAAIALYVGELSAYESFTYFTGAVPGGDFRSFWVPARLVWIGDAQGAYNPASFGAMTATFMPVPWYWRLGTMYYPPTYLLFLAPFGLLDFFAAHIAFFLCGLMLFMATLWVITRRVWFLLFMLCFAGIWVNLVSGQNGLYTASLMGLGYALLASNPVISGICFGLLTIKPHLGLLIPVALVAARAWRTIFAATLTALFLAILAPVLFGADIWTLGLTGMFSATFNLAQQSKLWARIPSVFSALRVAGFAPGAAMLMQLMLLLPMAVIVWGVWRNSRNYNLNAVVSCCAALIVLPFFYDYDMALLGVAVAFMAVEISRNGWWWGERLVLPFMIVWPMVVNKLIHGLSLQLGVLGPIFLMLLAIRRILNELKVAPPPTPALNTAA